MTDLEEAPCLDDEPTPAQRALERIPTLLEELAVLRSIVGRTEDYVRLSNVSVEEVLCVNVGINNGVTTPYTIRRRYFTTGGEFIGEV